MNNIFLTSYHAGYFKKEDCRKILKSRQVYSTIIIAGLGFAFAIMQIFVQPKLRDLVSTLGSDIPPYSNPYIGFGLLILCGYLITPDKKKDEIELEKKLAKYKPGEMILMSDLVDHSLEWRTILIVILFTGYIVVSNILPIYNLTSTF